MTVSETMNIGSHGANTVPQANSSIYARIRSIAALSLALLGAATAARSQESTGQKEERTTGLPHKGDWTFNFDAGAGAFGFDHSLYTDPKPDPSGNLSDNWFESYVKPAVSADFPLQGGGAFFGKLSAVAERTFSAPPTLVGESASSLLAEDVYVGWRSGTSMKLGEDAFQITLGRAPYKIGHGFLISDGAADGGSRGGYWSGPRKAWEYAGIGRFNTKGNTVEVFYLDRDELHDGDTGTKLAGANYELAIGENNTLGVSYIKAKSDTLHLRDGMDVYDARAFVAPLRVLPNLSFELEYAQEENGDALSAAAWTAQIAYTMSNVGWTPQISYRYAVFEGDDPNTPKNEAFDSLFPGFYDWGTWWQGEIVGEYFLSNSNLASQQVRVHVKPTESVGAGLIAYDFRLDQPATFAQGVTSDDIGSEIDGYVDWKLNKNFTASVVLGYAEPRKAIEQAFGRTDAFTYGMFYLAYAY